MATENDWVIQDMQRTIEEYRSKYQRMRAIAYSLAKYHAADSDKTVFEIIEDEGRWIDQQAEWNEGNFQ